MGNVFIAFQSLIPIVYRNDSKNCLSTVVDYTYVELSTYYLYTSFYIRHGL